MLQKEEEKGQKVDGRKIKMLQAMLQAMHKQWVTTSHKPQTINH